MVDNRKFLLLSSGLLLVLSFVSLLGFLKHFDSIYSVIWEVLFLLFSAYFVFSKVSGRMFKLSLFYALNLIILIVVNFYNSSNISFAFFIIAAIIMSLGFVIAVNNITKPKKPLPKKSIEELREEVDRAFDNITASSIELEKYYDKESLAAKDAKKSVKKKAVKKKR